MANNPEPIRLTARDGVLLHAELSSAQGEPFGVVFVHGFGEHVGRYHHVMAWMAERGVPVLGVDLRGHGHSTGRRSFINRFEEYLYDVDAAMAEAKNRFDGRAIFLGGHSMGGLIAARYAQTRPVTLRGLVLSSPGFRFSVEVSGAKKAVGHIMSRVWPSLALPAGVPSDRLTHVKAVVDAYDADRLVNKNATARWYTESLAAQAAAVQQASHIHLPVLALCAGADEVVSTPTTVEWMGKIASTDKTTEVLEGMYHEIFNEAEHEDFFAIWLEWMRARAA